MPTHLLFHPGHVLGEVAQLPVEEALTFLQERGKPWAGGSPRNQQPNPPGQAELAFLGAPVRGQGWRKGLDCVP